MLAALTGAAALATMAMSPPASTQQNGTTLAASKTLEICVVDETTWRFYGEISVWNAGAIATQGLSINDFIEQKAETGPKWNLLCAPAEIAPNPTSVAAGTTLETATVFDYLCEGPAGSLTQDIRNTVQVTITNHSGRLGKAFGPSPKATVYKEELATLPFCDEEPDGCTLTIGYWGNHPEDWPEGYSPNDWFFSSEYRWGQLLPPINAGANNNGYIQLARQYIAATLNMANGAGMPSGLKTDIYDLATKYFEETVVTPAVACPQASSCGTQKAWAGQLDTYNNGLYEGGPRHCDDE